MNAFGLSKTDSAAIRIAEAATRGTLSHALLLTGSGDRLATARYAAAVEWGFIALAATEMMKVVRARFPSSDWTTETGRVDSAVSAFFTWQSGATYPRSEDCDRIFRMTAHLEKKDKLVLARSSTASRKTLENAIKSVGARKTRYEDGKLY